LNPSETGSNRIPRSETVVRSILLAAAAVLVIGTSNYFAYLIGRKQATYEELLKQVDRVVQLIGQKHVEEGLPVTTLKQRQDRLEQNASSLTGITTSTINGKTIAVAPEPTPAESPIPAPVIDPPSVTPPSHDARLQPPETTTDAKTRNRDTRGVTHQRGPRRPKVAKQGANDAFAQQRAQSTTPIPANPDVGLAGQ
jgi:hypothetical protein